MPIASGAALASSLADSWSAGLLKTGLGGLAPSAAATVASDRLG